MYTCCTAATAHRVYHPGDVVTLHWRRSTGNEGRDKAAETLKSRLDGPFGLEAHTRVTGVPGSVQATGRPIQVAAGTAAPVSAIRIPANATPGMYRVTTYDIEGPGTLTTKTVIRVVTADR